MWRQERPYHRDTAPPWPVPTPASDAPDFLESGIFKDTRGDLHKTNTDAWFASARDTLHKASHQSYYGGSASPFANAQRKEYRDALQDFLNAANAKYGDNQ